MLIRIGSLGRRLRAYFANLQKVRDEGVPYVTRFTSSTTPPSNLRLKDFPGLLFLQYVESQDGISEVIVYWKSLDAMKSNESSFKRFLQVGEPQAQGYLRELKGHEKSWWQRIPVGRWLLYAASLFGALAVLQTHFAKLLEQPDITLEIPGPRVIDMLVADDISFDVGVTNRSREAHSVVTLLSPKLVGQGHNALWNHKFWFNPKPAPIAPSSTSVVQFKGDALPKGIYVVTIAAEASTGYLRDGKMFDVKKQINVWGREPEAHFISVEVEDRRRALLKGQVAIGAAAPKGLTCQITVQGYSTIKFGFVDFPGVSDWKAQPDTVDVRSITFAASRQFERLSRIPFEVILDSSVDVANWTAVRSNSTVECTKIEGAML